MAYALVISLKQTLKPHLDPSRSRLQIPDSEVRQLYDDLCYLKSFFDKMNSIKDSNSVEEVEKEIKDVLQTTRDLIECHLSDLFLHSGSDIWTAELAEKLAEAKARIACLINLFKAKEVYLTVGGPAVALDVPVSPSFGLGRNNGTVGLEDEVIGLKKLIFRGVKNSSWNSSLRVMSVTGIAGIGKTALATKVFEDPEIIKEFPLRVFVSVGLEYELEELLLSLLRQLGTDEVKKGTVDELGQQLFDYLNGGKYLAVVDDIRDTRAWSELQQFFPHYNNHMSVIILTTRTTAVASCVCPKENILLKRFLTTTESWELLREISFPGTDSCPPELENVGKKIARKLLGVPLAVVEIGQLLSNSPATVENWKAVNPDASQLIPKILKQSYAELPHHLEACFLYLGLFPPNYIIPTSKLFKLWDAEGFINLLRDENGRPDEYLEDLVSRCLVEVHERSSRGGIKSCGVRLPFHYLCVHKAREDKLFHVVKMGNGNVAPPGIKKQQRLRFHNNILLGLKQVRNLMRSARDARSLLYVGSQHLRPLQLYLELRRLRVLHAFSIRFWEFPNAVAKLVGLKYLAITFNGVFPSSIFRLWNLETLIISRSQRVHHLVTLPLEIWKLCKLRHLYCIGFDLPDPRDDEMADSMFLDKLLILSGVSVGTCTPGILSRMPQLVKIGVWFESTHHQAVEKLFADDDPVFSRLQSLESIKCVFTGLGFRPPVATSNLTVFPSTLTKVTLGGCGFSWDLMRGIGCLPLLQVLKLQSSAFCGHQWTTLEGEFRSLKYLLMEALDLKYMVVGSHHFPRLTQLVIRHCYKLQEIPVTFGEITTLSVLEVEDCSSAVVESARRILQEQDELGNDGLKFVITSSWDHRRSYIKEKYSSESWFVEKFPSASITVKDFLKLSVANPLEKLLGVKCQESSFPVRLTYTLSDASANKQPISETNGCSKRRKIDNTDLLKNSADLQKVDGHDLTSNSSSEHRDDEISFPKFPLEKANQCCSLVFRCYKTSVYVGGRYLKYSRNVSQSRWIIDDERMGEASVEEIVGSNILPICQGDNYKFHAAGREDIDVRMLGTGRPFLVEIQNARQFPSDLLIKEIENKINSSESKYVWVKNLRFLGSQGWELMREGEAEKQKQYAALVWISRPFENEDEQKLSTLTDLQILQKTPIRVLHRRSPLERERTIHWMKIERIAGSSQYFLLHLCTQAGTYIKEFVHGDLGRTNPSTGSILGCRAEILQLDVTDVKMDCFQA